MFILPQLYPFSIQPIASIYARTDSLAIHSTSIISKSVLNLMSFEDENSAASNPFQYHVIQQLWYCPKHKHRESIHWVYSWTGSWITVKYLKIPTQFFLIIHPNISSEIVSPLLQTILGNKEMYLKNGIKYFSIFVDHHSRLIRMTPWMDSSHLQVALRIKRWTAQQTVLLLIPNQGCLPTISYTTRRRVIYSTVYTNWPHINSYSLNAYCDIFIKSI